MPLTLNSGTNVISNLAYESASPSANLDLSGLNLYSDTLKGTSYNVGPITAREAPISISPSAPYSSLTNMSYRDNYIAPSSASVPWWLQSDVTSGVNLFSPRVADVYSPVLTSTPISSDIGSLLRKDLSFLPDFNKGATGEWSGSLSDLGSINYLSDKVATLLKDSDALGLVNDGGDLAKNALIDKLISELASDGDYSSVALSPRQAQLVGELIATRISDNTTLGLSNTDSGLATISSVVAGAITKLPSAENKFLTYDSALKYATNKPELPGLEEYIRNTKNQIVDSTTREKRIRQYESTDAALKSIEADVAKLPDYEEYKVIKERVSGLRAVLNSGEPGGLQEAATGIPILKATIISAKSSSNKATTYLESSIADIGSNRVSAMSKWNTYNKVPSVLAQSATVAKLEADSRSYEQDLLKTDRSDPAYPIKLKKAERATQELASLVDRVGSTPNSGFFMTTYADPSIKSEYNTANIFMAAATAGGLLMSLYTVSEDSKWKEATLEEARRQDEIDREERQKDREAQLEMASIAAEARTEQPERGSGPAASSAISLKPVTVG